MNQVMYEQRSPNIAHARLAQKGEYQVRMTEVPSPIVTAGNILLVTYFCFHAGKPLIIILPISVCE